MSVDTHVRRHCPVCGTEANRPELEKAGLRLVRCVHCAMVYANPVPAQYVTGEYYDRAGTSYYLSPAKLQSDYSPVRFERELRVFRKHCAGGTVLDVGCSSGAFLYQLAHRFAGDYTVVGTDVSGPPLDYAESRGIAVRRGNFLEQDWPQNNYDAVTFWAVLEHLPDPKAFIQKASEVLKPSGCCFVLVPNYESLATRVLGAKYRYIYPQHLNYFTRGTLTALVADRFSVSDVRFTHFNPMVIWQDWRHAGRDVSNEDRASLLKRTTRFKQNRWLTPARLLYRFVEKMLAARGLADNLVLVLRPRQQDVDSRGASARIALNYGETRGSI